MLRLIFPAPLFELVIDDATAQVGFEIPEDGKSFWVTYRNRKKEEFDIGCDVVPLGKDDNSPLAFDVTCRVSKRNSTFAEKEFTVHLTQDKPGYEFTDLG